MPQGADYLVLTRLGMPMVMAIMIKIVCLFKQVKQMLWNVVSGIAGDSKIQEFSISGPKLVLFTL